MERGNIIISQKIALGPIMYKEAVEDLMTPDNILFFFAIWEPYPEFLDALRKFEDKIQLDLNLKNNNKKESYFKKISWSIIFVFYNKILTLSLEIFIFIHD